MKYLKYFEDVDQDDHKQEILDIINMTLNDFDIHKIDIKQMVDYALKFTKGQLDEDFKLCYAIRDASLVNAQWAKYPDFVKSKNDMIVLTICGGCDGWNKIYYSIDRMIDLFHDTGSQVFVRTTLHDGDGSNNKNFGWSETKNHEEFISKNMISDMAGFVINLWVEL